jgi:hypothetical protein
MRLYIRWVRPIAVWALGIGMALWLSSGLAGASGATAGISSRELALMPLPSSALGPEVTTLPLAQDSGVVTNGDAVNHANQTVDAATFARLGRLTGYTLDYGESGPSRPGVFQAQTTVELYRSPAAAAAGLAFWRKDATTPPLPPGTDISTAVSRCAAGALGRASFCDAQTVKLAGKGPLYATDIDFSTGSLVAQVSISATSARVSRALGAAAAKGLARRIAQVLAGRIGGPPVRLPARAKPGPPAHGPSLAAIALTPADLGSGTVDQQGYQVDTSLEPVSEYVRNMAPAGTLATLAEEVLLFRSPTQASYELALLSGILSSPQGWRQDAAQGAGVKAFLDPRSVTLAAAGDESRNLLGTAVLSNGARFSLGFLFLRVGDTVEFVTFGSQVGAHLLPAAVVQLAHLVAAQAERGLRAGARTGSPTAA